MRGGPLPEISALIPLAPPDLLFETLREEGKGTLKFFALTILAIKLWVGDSGNVTGTSP